MNLLPRILLILLAVLLTRLSLPGFGMPHFVWVAMIPFFLAQRIETEPRWGSSTASSSGICRYGGCPRGDQQDRDFLAAGVAATVLFCLYHAVPYLLFGYRAKWFADDDGLGGVLRDTVLLTVLISNFSRSWRDCPVSKSALYPDR